MLSFAYLCNGDNSWTTSNRLSTARSYLAHSLKPHIRTSSKFWHWQISRLLSWMQSTLLLIVQRLIAVYWRLEPINYPAWFEFKTAKLLPYLNALDCGATGIQIPHVCTAEQAQKLVKVSHYGEGGRGYAGSSRAAQYATKPMANHLQDSKNNTVVIAQIEDPEGVINAESIAAVEGVDALFIGQVDLAVSYGAASMNEECVREASIKIIKAAQQANKPVGMFVANAQASS